MASTEPPPQPIKPKTCFLRVSCHCEGCKRKIKKILQSIPGVDGVEIEKQFQRVVVTGDVSPESLVRKLVKSGKHAALWPEIPPQNHGRDIIPPCKDNIAVSGKDIKPPASKTESQAVDSSEASDTVVDAGVAPAGIGGRKVNEGGDGGGEKVNDGKIKGGGGKVNGGGDNDVGKVNGGGDNVGKFNGGGDGGKVKEKKLETGSAGDAASPAAVKKEQETENGGGVGGGGGEGKKKKKKEGQNNNINNTGEASSSGPSPPAATATRSTHQSPPPHHGYEYTSPYHHQMPPPAPVYTVSYNTAHPPVNSYTAAYYAAAPPQYAYSQFGPASAAAPPPVSVPADYGSYTQQPMDSFEMFSDENPNGCLVM